LSDGEPMRYMRCEICNAIIDQSKFDDYAYQRSNKPPEYPKLAYRKVSRPEGDIEERKRVCSPECEARFEKEFDEKHKTENMAKASIEINEHVDTFICSGCGKVLTVKTGTDINHIDMELLKFGSITEQHVVCSPECRAKVKESFETRHGLRGGRRNVNT